VKAVVIGASGHIGNAVTRALLDEGHEVTACGRRLIPPANLDGLPVRYQRGDADIPGQFEKWIDGHDLVVDAAAPYSIYLFPDGGRAQLDPMAHAEKRTRMLLEAVARRDVPLVYVSSFSTRVRPRTSFEQWHLEIMKIVHPYLHTKELVESLIRDRCRRGLRAVIVNPTMCLGPWDVREREMCLIPQLLNGRMPATSTQMLNVIDVRDVAASIISALRKEIYGAPITLTGPSLRAEQLFSRVCELGGVRSPRIPGSATLALPASFWWELGFGMAGRKAPLPTLAMIFATMIEWLVPDEMQNRLDVPVTPLDETIMHSIEWYRSIGYCETKER
jgi:dihydroflavonol-4-reductase